MLTRLVIVDLERRRVSYEPLSAAQRRRLGGAALGATLFEQFFPGAAGPLDPASPWILSIGPLTGTPLSPRPQAVVTHLSPQTGGLNDSVVSHPLADALATSGTAAIVLTGASETPVWLRLDAEAVEFEDASRLWGKNLDQAAADLRARVGAPALAVGPAAERGVLYASLGSGAHSAGRGGAGAALAAKRVKGIAAPAVVHAAPPGTAAGARSGAAPGTSTRGLASLERLRALNDRMGLPTRNFRRRSFEETAALAGALQRAAARRRLPYEAVFAFGPLLGVSDAGAILRCLERCDQLGIDVISAGGTLAWAMEAAEAGVLEAPLPRFGESAGLESWLEAAVRGEGAGALLARGCRAGSAELGRGSGAWAMHVRGLEIPGYDPRAFPSMALGYAVGSRGACHVRSGAYQADLEDPLPDPPDPLEVARRAADFEDRSTLLDSLILDRGARSDLGEPFAGAARLLRQAGHGDLADAGALRETMREVADLRRRINLARGWSTQEDTLPERILREDGGAASAVDAPRLRSWVSAYYARRGWSADGRPPAGGSGRG